MFTTFDFLFAILLVIISARNDCKKKKGTHYRCTKITDSTIPETYYRWACCGTKRGHCGLFEIGWQGMDYDLDMKLPHIDVEKNTQWDNEWGCKADLCLITEALARDLESEIILKCNPAKWKENKEGGTNEAKLPEILKMKKKYKKRAEMKKKYKIKAKGEIGFTKGGMDVAKGDLGGFKMTLTDPDKVTKRIVANQVDENQYEYESYDSEYQNDAQNQNMVAYNSNTNTMLFMSMIALLMVIMGCVGCLLGGIIGAAVGYIVSTNNISVNKRMNHSMDSV